MTKIISHICTRQGKVLIISNQARGAGGLITRTKRAKTNFQSQKGAFSYSQEPFLCNNSSIGFFSYKLLFNFPKKLYFYSKIWPIILKVHYSQMMRRHSIIRKLNFRLALAMIFCISTPNSFERKEIKGRDAPLTFPTITSQSTCCSRGKSHFCTFHRMCDGSCFVPFLSVLLVHFFYRRIIHNDFNLISRRGGGG